MTDLPLTKISETAATIMLGWQPVAGAVGYRFQSAANKPKWSHTWDPARTTVRFARGDGPYRVQALGALADGTWPTAAPTDWWQTVQTQLPLFTPARTIAVTSEATLRTAIAGLRAGDYVVAANPFTVARSLRITNRLDGAALLDLAEVSFRVGGSDIVAAYLDGAANVWVNGGDIRNDWRRGIQFEDTSGCKWHGFHVHDCGDHGLFVTSIAADNVALDVQGEISNCGLRWSDPSIDPHSEPGTGVHGAYVGARFTEMRWTTGARIVLDVHDQHAGAAAQIGGTIRDSAVFVRAQRITFNAQRQVAGSGIQVWGEARDLEMQVEASDLAGRAVDTNGLYGGATGIRVTHGRAVRCCTNPKLAGQSPYQPHPGVVYTDCS